MTPQGENQKQLHLGHIVFFSFLFFFSQVANWRGEDGEKKRGRMMQTSAPRSLRENQRPPGRAAELNYRENTVAEGSREGCGIDLSHGGGGGGDGGGAGGSEGRSRVRGRANWKQSEERGKKGKDEIGKRSEGEQTAEGGGSVKDKHARLQGGSAARGAFIRPGFDFFRGAGGLNWKNKNHTHSTNEDKMRRFMFEEKEEEPLCRCISK